MNEVDEFGFTGWSMVALYAPKSLDRLIDLVDLGSDSQKKSVISALNEVDEFGCIGWLKVAQHAPKSLDKLISLVTDDQKTSVINALNEAMRWLFRLVGGCPARKRES